MSWGKIVAGIATAGFLATSGYFFYRAYVPSKIPDVSGIRQIASELGGCANQAENSSRDMRRDCIDKLTQQMFDEIGANPAMREKLAPATDNMIYVKDSYDILNNPDVYKWAVGGIETQINTLTEKERNGTEADTAWKVFLIGGIGTIIVALACYAADDDWQ
jgi:hypothetical protein